MLEIRCTDLQLFRSELMELVGQKVGRTLLYRMGISLAHSIYVDHIDRIKSEEESWATIVRLFQRRGWGNISDHKWTADRCEVTMQDSAFAEGQTHRYPPVCDIMRGILAGWVSSYYKK